MEYFFAFSLSFWFFSIGIIFLAHPYLRIYAGGLHFSTRIRCFIASLFIFVVVLFFPLAFSSFKLCKAINPFIILGLIIILFFAPVEDPRKPLEISESLHHRKISRILGINYVILSTIKTSFSTYLFVCCFFNCIMYVKDDVSLYNMWSLHKFQHRFTFSIL